MTTQEDTDKIQALQEEVNALKAVLSKVTADNTDHVWAHFREEGTTEDISAGVRATNLPEAWDKFMDGVKYAAQKYQIVLTGSIHTEPEPAGVLSPTGTLQMSISKSPNEPQYVEVGDMSPQPSVVSIGAQPGRFSPEGMPLEEQDQTVGTIYRYTCVMFEVTPQDGGKASVKLYGNMYNNPGGVDKFAYVTVWGTPAQLANTFASVGQWPESTFMTAKKFKLTQPFYVNWTLSDKKNTAGHHYRNLSSLMPIVTPSTP